MSRFHGGWMDHSQQTTASPAPRASWRTRAVDETRPPATVSPTVQSCRLQPAPPVRGKLQKERESRVRRAGKLERKRRLDRSNEIVDHRRQRPVENRHGITRTGWPDARTGIVKPAHPCSFLFPPLAGWKAGMVARSVCVTTISSDEYQSSSQLSD